MNMHAQGALTVTPRQTRQGIVYDVYFRHNKRRHRFTITDAGTYPDARTKAQQLRDGVVAGRLVFRPKAARLYPSGTVGSFRKLYEKELAAAKLSDTRRPLGIVDNLLLPRFGQLPFAELTRQHGLDLMLGLRKEGYEEQGIRRIVNVARRYVNLAIRHRQAAHNPFLDLPLQPYTSRERIASPEDLQQLLSLASDRMRTAIALALNLPLREELILEASRDHRYRRPDGWWYRPPKAPTTIKGRPLELPLNASAVTMFDRLDSSQPDVFPGWKPDKFKKAWRRLCRRAQVDDLHFHDLRRNAGSALQEARVHPGVISLLLGHKSREVSDIYKTFDSWRPDLRRAVDILETVWLNSVAGLPCDPDVTIQPSSDVGDEHGDRHPSSRPHRRG